MRNLTLSIQREYFEEILNGTKTKEYREIKPTNKSWYLDANNEVKEYDNVLQIAEGGEIEVQILNIAQMIIRSTTLDFSTTSPLWAMCCYVSVFFFIFCAWAIK